MSFTRFFLIKLDNMTAQQRIQDKSVAMEGSNKIVDGAVDLGKGSV